MLSNIFKSQNKSIKKLQNIEKFSQPIIVGTYGPQKMSSYIPNDEYLPVKSTTNNLSSNMVMGIGAGAILDENNVNEVKNLLEKLLKLYKSNSNIVDHLYVEKLLSNK